MFMNFIREERIKKRYSLRSFCQLAEEDPSNWSKIERGVMNPPTDKKRLLKIAKILDIDEDSEEFKNLYDLACMEVKQIPDYIADDKELLMELPAFFRTIENIKPTKDELQKLVETLRNRK